MFPVARQSWVAVTEPCLLPCSHPLSPQTLGGHGSFAAPRLEVLDFVHGRGTLHPLDDLAGRHDIHVLQLHQLVDEAVKGVQVVLRVEPARVQEDAEGGTVGLIVTL